MITVILVGTSLTGVGGISTHMKQIFYSVLAEELRFIVFQVGSEGLKESVMQKIVRFVFSPIKFSCLLIKSKAQIVHVNTSIVPMSFWRDAVYVCVARIMGKKIIYQVHGGKLPQDFVQNRYVFGKIFKWLLRSNNITVVLLGQAELIAYRKFDPNLLLEVIPNAIEAGPDPQWKEYPSIFESPLKLIYVGRLVKEKGVFEIIEALKLLHSKNRNIQLIIVGSGPDESMLHTFINSMGLHDMVSFLGVLHNEEKTRVWEEADLFIFPTYCTEGLPYALLESMATRTPSLVCPVGVISDVIEDSVHGFFIPPQNAQALADKIEQLDKDRALICHMGSLCRQRILEYYTIDRMVGDFRRTYFKILTH